MTFSCIRCAKTFEDKICVNRKYCSRECDARMKTDMLYKQIELEGSITHCQSGRRYFLEKFGNICMICNLSVWKDNPIPLVLDHIDGNSDNNKLENLRLICPNCDALLPTYKARNKGRGRVSRRKQLKPASHSGQLE